MRIRKVLADPSVSFTLKKMLGEAAERDPLDALKDAELLAELLRERWIATRLLTLVKDGLR